LLKKRIIPTLLYKDMTLVKGVAFDSWRRVGSVIQAVKVYNMRDVDELIFEDITASIENRRPDFNLVDDFADECFMPLTVGGGIKTIDDIKRLLNVGADKVSINSASISNPELIKEASAIFGAQCIVVSIDVKFNNNKYEVFSNAGKTPTGIDALSHAKNMEKSGAGEILLTSIDSDGSMNGYCLDIIRNISKNISIPLIASGGAGNYNHILDVLKINGVDAAAAASIFHFTEQTPIEAKQYLKKNGIPVRV
jgi:imidazole glycerol-phosphate synthase subunit HisF